MAISGTNLTADQIAWAAADYPLIGVSNALASATTITWKTAAKASATDDFEARLHDGRTGLYTAPTGAAAANWLIDITWTSGSPAFDFVAFIINESVAQFTELDVRIADTDFPDEGGATNQENIALVYSNGLADNAARGCNLSLGSGSNPAPNSYSGVNFMRIQVNPDTADNPQIGELFLGQRYQMPSHPRVPWDNNHLTGDVAVSEAHNGARVNYVYYEGQRIVDARYNPHTDARIADLQDQFRNSGHGTELVMWHGAPNSTAREFIFANHQTPTQAAATLGLSERDFSIHLIEQAPHFRSEDLA